MWLMQKHPYKICACSWHGHLETSVIMELFSRKHLGWNYKLSATTNVPNKLVPLTAQNPALLHVQHSQELSTNSEAMPSNPLCATLLPHEPLELAYSLCAKNCSAPWWVLLSLFCSTENITFLPLISFLWAPLFLYSKRRRLLSHLQGSARIQQCC